MLAQHKPVRFQVHCVAGAKILPYKHVENLDFAPCSQSLGTWNGTKVKHMGTCALPVVNPRNNAKYKVRFLIVKENLTPLMGLNATEKMGLLTEQGWRSGERARLPPCVPCSIPGPDVMWVNFLNFVVGFLLCSERFFSGYSDFPLSSKPVFPNTNSILECTDISERGLVSSLVLGGQTNHFTLLYNREGVIIRFVTLYKLSARAFSRDPLPLF